MNFQLDEPFSSMWRKGFLRVSKKDKRKRVDLFNSNKDRTTITYARYLMCVNLGYIIPDEFEVDHIDSDKTNDELSNLQVLSIQEHLEKTSRERSTGRTGVTLLCECCGKEFFRESRNLNKSKVWNVCSRSCNGKMSKKDNRSGRQKVHIPEEVKSLIIELRSQGYSDYKISPIIHISRSRIQRFRKEQSIP